MVKVWACILMLAVAGCGSKIMQHVDEQFAASTTNSTDPAATSYAPAATAPNSTSTRVDSGSSATAEDPPQVRSNRFAVKPADPPPMFRPQANLSIYRYSVPAGTVSRSENFWKRVEEQAVAVDIYDALFKNGIRVGRAPLADMDYFIKLLERAGAEQAPAVFAAPGVKDLQLPMRKGVADQIIADFDLRNVMTTRSYEDCDDLFVIDFAPAPRKNGDVRLNVAPVVRTLRKRLVPISDTDTREIEYRPAETYFHLNLKTDIPLDSFLIIAPSPEAHSRWSLGNAFLMRDGVTERLEEVLIIIPQAIRPKPQKLEANAVGANLSNP